MPKDGDEPRIGGRSDADGRVVFVLPSAGIWLINAVHMIEAPAGSDAAGRACGRR